jgi:hypothetical protein
MQYPDLEDMLISYPAGFNLSLGQRIRARSMGLKAGVPDLILLVPRLIRGTLYPLLFIEMKSKDGKLSAIQKAYHHKLKAQGYTIVIAYSTEEAMIKIKSYLDSET